MNKHLAIRSHFQKVEKPKLVLASDHNGVRLKSKLKEMLSKEGYFYIDLGPYGNDFKVDYVNYAEQLGMIVQDGFMEKGILICGTGIGMSIVANKINNIRASLVHNKESASKTREHNNSNVLCLGAWINSDDKNLELTKIWLEEKFGEYRHIKRVEKINKYNKKDKIVFIIWYFEHISRQGIELIDFAKFFGDKLIIGVQHGKQITQENMNYLEEQRSILQSIKHVNDVIMFSETLQQITEILNPDFIVVAGNFTGDEFQKTQNLSLKIPIKVFLQ